MRSLNEWVPCTEEGKPESSFRIPAEEREFPSTERPLEQDATGVGEGHGEFFLFIAKDFKFIWISNLHVAN